MTCLVKRDYNSDLTRDILLERHQLTISIDSPGNSFPLIVKLNLQTAAQKLGQQLVEGYFPFPVISMSWAMGKQVPFTTASLSGSKCERAFLNP